MKKTQTLTFTAMLLGLLFLLAFTPLGFIPIGPINATTMHIPVIIASILLGPKIGGMLGGVFGGISLFRATVFPTPLSFVFSPFYPVIGTELGSYKALIVVFLPRILIGVVPYFVYYGLKKWIKKATPALFVAGVIGSLTNTLLVMNFIYFLFAEPYGTFIGKSGPAVYSAIISIIVGTGIPEAIVAGIATAAVCNILLRLNKTYNQSMYD